VAEQVNWEEVLTRLARIKALADRAGTLAEAEAASTMMAKLLLRYNLSLIDVERHATSSGQAQTSEAVWKRLLLRGVAEGHLCQAVHQDGTGHGTIVGHAHNLIVAREMYFWLVGEINRLCQQARTQAAADDELARDRPRTWSGNFRMGAASAIYESYQRMLLEAQRETDGEVWALVPLMTEEVNALMRQLFPTIKTRTYSISDATAFDHGRAAGASISLQKQVAARR
jgi:hypothetical protein